MTWDMYFRPTDPDLIILNHRALKQENKIFNSLRFSTIDHLTLVDEIQPERCLELCSEVTYPED